MSLISNFFKRSFFSGNGAAIALVLALGSYGLATYAHPTQSTTEFNAARAVTDLQCVGWSEGGSSVRQRLIVANGADVATGDNAEVTIGDKIKGLLPGASRETDLKSGKSKHITAEGESAQRISALMTASKTSGDADGLAVDSCRTPSQNWWFAGIDTQAGYTSNLVLTNTTDTETVATLTGFTADGKTSMGEYSNVVVPAQGMTVVDVTRALPGIKSVAVHVHVVDGRLAAALQTDVVEGIKPVGRSFTSPVETLSTRSMIVGLRDSSDETQLHLVSPLADSIVSVILHTPDGAFPITVATDLNLDAGVVKTIDLTEVIETSKASLEIVSDQPALAAVTMVSRVGAVRDYQVFSQQAPILKGAVAALPSELKLSGFQAISMSDTAVTVSAFQAGESVWTKTTNLYAGEVSTLELSDQRETGMVFVVSSDSGEVFVTMWLEAKTSRGSYTSAVALLDPSTQTIAGVTLMLRTS
jgi:hypothetical protein